MTVLVHSRAYGNGSTLGGVLTGMRAAQLTRLPRRVSARPDPAASDRSGAGSARSPDAGE